MISFVKIHMVACNYKDSTVLVNNPDYKKRLAASKIGDKDHGDQKVDKALERLTPREIHYAEGLLGGAPTFVEWTSFMFPIIGCYWGASMEYRDFQDFINLRGNYKNVPVGKTWYPGVVRVVHTLLCAVISLLIATLHKEKLTMAETFEGPDACSIYMITFYLWCAVEQMQYKILTTFAARESNFIVSGFGYKPENKKTGEPENFNSVRVGKLIAC